MDINFDLDKERECFACFYDLHLSAVGCQCSVDKYSCLRHSNSFGSCECDERFVLIRYTIEELNELVRALEGELEPIKVWTNRASGMVSVDGGNVCLDKPCVGRDMCKTKVNEVESSSSCERIKKLKLNEEPHYSHVSSELVQSESQVESAPQNIAESHNDNVDAKSLIMDDEIKVSWSCNKDLNLNVVSDENESYVGHVADGKSNNGIGCVEKACYPGPQKEQEDELLDGDGNMPDRFSPVKRDNQSCSNDDHTLGKSNSGKMYGDDVLMNKGLRVLPNSECKMEEIDSFDKNTFLETQSFLIEKLTSSVEPISLGFIVYGKLWSRKHVIYPKGISHTITFCPLDFSICIYSYSNILGI